MKYIPFAIRRRFLPESIPLHQPSNQNVKTVPTVPLMVEATKFLSGGRIMMGEYVNDKTRSFNVVDAETGEHIYVATCNIQNANFKANEKYVYLRSWGIFEGVPEAFEKTGLIKLTGLYHQFDNDARAPLALISPRFKGNFLKKDSE